MTPEDISLSSSYLTHCAKIGPFSDFFASQLPHVFHCRGVDICSCSHVRESKFCIIAISFKSPALTMTLQKVMNSLAEDSRTTTSLRQKRMLSQL